MSGKSRSSAKVNNADDPKSIFQRTTWKIGATLCYYGGNEIYKCYRLFFAWGRGDESLQAMVDGK